MTDSDRAPELQQGESVSLGTRVDGGPHFQRDENVEDTVIISGHGGELSRDEIKRLAECVGLDVGRAEGGR